MSAFSESSLERIAALSRLMLAQEEELRLANERVDAAKEALNRTRREDLPELMRELGVDQIRLTSGEVVTVKDDVIAAIPAARMREAVGWLAERGYDGIVKTQVAMEYGRGEYDTAKKDARALEEMTGRRAALDEKIHPQTLRAFIRERMAAGEAVPFDLFGVQPFSEAKIKRP